MKKTRCFGKIFALFMALCLLVGLVPTAFAATAAPTEAEVYERMIALKTQYTEGMPWTNDNFYEWKGGIFFGGYGCAGFAFLLSDAAFGDLPATYVEPVSFDDVRAGDILRVNGDSHSVIVLQVETDGVVIAEGNFNSSIHWGRTLTRSEVEKADYMLTRYPETPEEKPDDLPTHENCPTADYTDVRTHWAHEAIDYCVRRGLMYGVDDALFGPEKTTDRAMLVTVLWRNEGEPQEGTNVFSDVQTGRYYTAAVAWAAAHGIVNGVTETTFEPNSPITREQLATILYRCAGSPAAAEDGLAKFPDAGQVSNYARDAMRWAVAAGIIGGSNGYLLPQDDATRAEVATMLMRYLER